MLVEKTTFNILDSLSWWKVLQNKTEQLKQKVHQRRDIDFKVPGLSLFHFSVGLVSSWQWGNPIA